jgi:two-component system sensor histidine kinase MprB
VRLSDRSQARSGCSRHVLPGIHGSELRRRKGRTLLTALGLGLAIVRQVANSHGGEVSVEAAPGGGALFRLRVPQYAVVRAR